MNVSEIKVSEHRQAAHPVQPWILHRWSPRAMSGEPIDDATLMSLFEAARWAPSSFNEQPWRFVYETRTGPRWNDFLSFLMEANQAWCRNAAVLVAVLAKKTFTHNGSPNACHVFDAGSAWENAALQGASLGLVVHGMGGIHRDAIRQGLQVPDDYEVAMMFAVGRPGDVSVLPEPMQAREKPSQRKPFHEIVMHGGFGG